VEVRLAGILKHYNIPQAQLADRLHIVYLDEIEDPSSYTLANMRNDVAALNENMLGWLRDFPNAIAVMVDPLLAWHQIVENTNDGMQDSVGRAAQHCGTQQAARRCGPPCHQGVNARS